MRNHRRRTRTRTQALATAGLCALVAGTFVLSHAAATEPARARTVSPATAAALARHLDGRIPNGAADLAYYDSGTRRLVVNVADESVREAVEEAGAEARLVHHSAKELASVKDALTRNSVPGTARGIDPRTDRVVVVADRTVHGAALAELRRQVGAQHGKAVLRRTGGGFGHHLAGGDEVRGGVVGCSLGFNVTVRGKPGFLTAGHCTTGIKEWYGDRSGRTLAVTRRTSFPGDDYGLALYTRETPHPGTVDLYNGHTQRISGVGRATVGMSVARSGATTHLHRGRVTAVDVSVTFDEGDTVNGLIATTVCSENGDSGGPLFAGRLALGLDSGGDGDCRTGGISYYQPVDEVLSDLGAELAR